MVFFILGLINALIGVYFIKKGFEKHGKKEFLNNRNGYLYVFWVALSTFVILIQA